MAIDRQFLSLVFLLCSSNTAGLGVYGFANKHPGPSAVFFAMAVFFFGIHLMMLRPQEEKHNLTHPDQREEPKEEKRDVSQPDKRPDERKEPKKVKRKTSPRRKPKITTDSLGK